MRSKFLLLFVLIGVSLLFGLPHVLIPRLLGGTSYDPLGGGDGPQSAIVTEEVYTYVPEVQEILEGKFPVRDTQLAEYKKTPSPFSGETFPALFMAALSRLTGSAERAFMVSDFLFPPISVFLVYLLCRKLGVPKKLSTVAAVVSVVATDVISLVPYPKPLWDFFVNLKGKDDFLFFSRNFHPQLSFPLFALALLAVIEALRSPRRSKTIIAGILVGLQFYTYFFSWTAMLGTLGILVLWAICTRNKKGLKHLLAVVAVALTIGTPYFIEMQKFKLSPFYQDFFLKNTFLPRTFLPITMRYILLWIIAWRLSLPNKRYNIPVSLVVLLSTIASTVLLPEIANLLLDRDPEAKHWVRRLLMPLSFPLAAYFVTQLHGRQQIFRLSRRWTIVTCTAVFFVVAQFGFRIQVSASQRYVLSFHRSPEKQQLFDWINRALPKDAVVGTVSSRLIAEIPALTIANNAAPITTRSVATTKESLDRFLTLAALYRLHPDTVSYLLWSQSISQYDPERVQTLSQRYSDLQGSWISRTLYFTAVDQGKLFALSPERREKIVESYRSRFFDRIDINKTPYRVDYLILGPTERDLMDQNDLQERYEIAFQNKMYTMYDVRP